MVKSVINVVKNDGLLYALGLVIFFALVRYKGFDSDAAIYLLQVMNYLQPERFINDVPFMFGNQDSFSIFSPIVATIFRILGVNAGGMITTFIVLLAMGVAFITMVFKWTKLFNAYGWRFPIILALFVLLAGKEYGSSGLYLPMLESFLVARVLSEVLIVAGLVFIFDKNRYISLVFFIFSSLFHPLMGGWTLPLWLFFHFPKFRIPVLALAFLSPLSGYLHVGRFDFYPDDWKPLYLKPAWDEFVVYLGLLGFWVAMYRHFKEGPLARFSINLFWVSLVGFYLQFAASYVEHLLLYQAQPFRVQWLCTIPVIPVFALFVRDCLKNERNLILRDYAGLALGLCAIAACQWFVLLVVCFVFIFTPIGKKEITATNLLWSRILFAFGFVFLLACSVLNNFIQLAVELGVGNTGLAVSWMHVPAYLAVVENILFVVFALICISQKKYGYALFFAVPFCCNCLNVLPLIGIVLYLLPNLSLVMRRLLLAFSLSFSFFELQSSLHRPNSTNVLPLENAPVACVVLLIVLLVVAYWLMILKKETSVRQKLMPLFLLLVSLFVWDVYRWDSRNDIVVLNEKQMNAFFDTPIFPQVKDRGKLLFTVDYEAPIQSRINFMTGAYADESIYVGEVFYKEQFMESNRRRSALLTGSPQMVNLAKFKEEIVNVYGNPDTLLARVHYLCDAREITHFATDYANMPLPKQDSVYLNVKQKFVWLYGCPGN